MKFRSLNVALASLLWAGHASSITIDSNRFFAYAYNPGLRQYALLSHSSCIDAGASKKGWRAAAFTNGIGGLMPACWVDTTTPKYGPQVTACLVSSQTRKMGNACEPIGKGQFIDTSTLPRKANF
jgi:hypothetical protein